MRDDCSSRLDSLKYAENRHTIKTVEAMNTQGYLERRQQTLKLAQELVQERGQLWALHEQLLNMQPYTEEQALEPVARQFCQILVDYISLEHFGIYHHLLDGSERRRGVLELAEKIYPRIVETTDIALDFNEKCESFSPQDLRQQLAGELALLGEELAIRIELEDRLIDAMTA